MCSVREGAYSERIEEFHVLTIRHERVSCMSEHVVHVHAYELCEGICVVRKEAFSVYVRVFTRSA